ncbi:hypothetical protein ACQV5M_18155 [Leptospira sp. SA-E8]|uniref:hypothetical protein n=1 Tax=Leptospira sp. SA-E8 TaxID=3422259 RepID=UPI003EBBC7F6
MTQNLTLNVFRSLNLKSYFVFLLILLSIGCNDHSTEEEAMIPFEDISFIDRASGVVQAAQDSEASSNLIDSISSSFRKKIPSPRPVQNGLSLFRIKLDLSETSILNKEQGVRASLYLPSWKSYLKGFHGLGQLDGIELSINEIKFYKQGETLPNKSLKGAFPLRLGFGRKISSILPYTRLEEGQYSKIELVLSNTGKAFYQDKEYEVSLSNALISSKIDLKIVKGKFSNLFLKPNNFGGYFLDSPDSTKLENRFQRGHRTPTPTGKITYQLPSLNSKSWNSDIVTDAILKINGVTLVYEDGKKTQLSNSSATYTIGNLKKGNVALLASKSVNSGKIKEIILNSPRLVKITSSGSSNSNISFPFFQEIHFQLTANLKAEHIYETFIELDDSVSLFTSLHNGIYISSLPTFNLKSSVHFSNDLEQNLLNTLGTKLNLLAKNSEMVIDATTNSSIYQPIFDSNIGWVISSLTNLIVNENLNAEQTNINSVSLQSTGGSLSGLRMDSFGSPKLLKGERAIFFLNKNQNSNYYYFSSGVYSKVPFDIAGSSYTGNLKFLPDTTPVFSVEAESPQQDFIDFYRKELTKATKETLIQFDSSNTHSNLRTDYKIKITKVENPIIPNACSQEVLESLQNSGNYVKFSTNTNFLCSQSSCSFRWSCDGNKEIFAAKILVLPNIQKFSGSDESGTVKLSITKGIFSSIGFDSCQIGASNCTSTHFDTEDWFSPFFAKPSFQLLTTNKRDAIVAKYGALSSADEQLLTEIKNFASIANTYCDPSPCALPKDEQNSAFKPRAEEIEYYESYLTNSESSSVNDPTEFLTYNVDNQNLYFHSSRILKEPPERYMQNVISITPVRIAKLPPEYIRDHLKQLYFQILRREKILKELDDQLDHSYTEFIKSELKILIQIRREMLKALG